MGFLQLPRGSLLLLFEECYREFKERVEKVQLLLCA